MEDENNSELVSLLHGLWAEEKVLEARWAEIESREALIEELVSKIAVNPEFEQLLQRIDARKALGEAVEPEPEPDVLTEQERWAARDHLVLDKLRVAKRSLTAPEVSGPGLSLAQVHGCLERLNCAGLAARNQSGGWRATG